MTRWTRLIIASFTFTAAHLHRRRPGLGGGRRQPRPRRAPTDADQCFGFALAHGVNGPEAVRAACDLGSAGEIDACRQILREAGLRPPPSAASMPACNAGLTASRSRGRRRGQPQSTAVHRWDHSPPPGHPTQRPPRPLHDHVGSRTIPPQ